MGEQGPPLKAPFPWPGGKARVADLVWERLGNVDNYVEPFAGSLAVLLRRPAAHFKGGYRVETVNDLNHFVVNFWRAVAADPEAVARWADSPVTEADLHARHKWLMRSQHAADWRRWMAEDPEHYDAKVAGWWVWGACCWIGSGWCSDSFVGRVAMPQLDGRAGIPNSGPAEPAAQIDDLSGGFGNGTGVHGSRKMPHMDAAGRGVAAPGLSQQIIDMDPGRGGHRGRPQLTDAFDIGRGVNAGAALSRQVPLISGPGDGVDTVAGADGTNNHKRQDLGHELGVGLLSSPINPPVGACAARRAWLVEWMQRLADRLRLVRTCYGHWSRICDSESTLARLGTTGVFLDPPYPAKRADTGEASRTADLYATDKGSDLDALRDEVLAWCVKWGSDPNIRVAVCGYEGDGYEPLVAEHGWQEHAWEASGGYGNQRRKGKGKSENAKRERIWFSPACMQERTLFDTLSPVEV